MGALEAVKHRLIHIGSFHGDSFAVGPLSLSAEVIQLIGRSDGHGVLAGGVAIGQQHSNIARLGEQHGVQALFGGEGGEAGSHFNVQGVGLVVVAVGNGDGILIIHSHAGSAILHASNIGTIGNCSAICVFHSGSSAIGQNHVPNDVTISGSIVRNSHADEVNTDLSSFNVGNRVATLHDSAVNHTIDGEVQNLGFRGSLHRGQLHSVVIAHLGIGSIGHRELDGHVAIGIGVLVAVHLEIDHRAFTNIFVGGGSGGSIGVIHQILRPHYRLQRNCLRTSAVGTGKGIAVLGKQDSFVVRCSTNLLQGRFRSRSAERNHCDDQHERQKHRK